MDQIGGQHRLAGSGRAKVLGRDAAQLIVHHRYELMECLFTAGSGFFKEYSYIHRSGFGRSLSGRGVCQIKRYQILRNTAMSLSTQKFRVTKRGAFPLFRCSPRESLACQISGDQVPVASKFHQERRIITVLKIGCLWCIQLPDRLGGCDEKAHKNPHEESGVVVPRSHWVVIYMN